jgi:DNA repair exonuclease SbcCD nuclease subunit
MIYDRYISINDIHLVANNPVGRKDDLTVTQWGKIRFVFDYAEKMKAAILIAGDFGDASNNYSILNKLAALLKEYQEKGVLVFAVFGQHDLKYRNEEDTNLDILISAGLIIKLEKEPLPVAIGDIHYRIYGVNWGDSVPKLSSSEITNILVIHTPISPVALFHGHNYIDTKDFQKEHPEYKIVICGDVHRKFMEEIEGTIFLNSGPMVRKEADEYNMIHEPGFFFIDVKKERIKFVTIPHRPAEEVLTIQHIERKKRKSESAARADSAQFLHELNQRANKSEEETLDLRERLIQRLSTKKKSIPSGASSVIETLLNTGEVKTYGE